MSNATGLNISDQAPYYCTVPQQDTEAVLGFKVSLYILIITISLVGNILTIWVICRNRRMRNAVNYLIINMAVADLLVTSFNMVNKVVQLAWRTSQWTVRGLPGVLLCKTLIFMFGFSISCSILSLTAIAAERFVAIRFPLRRLLDTNKVKYVSVLIWLASLASVSPLLYAAKLIEIEGSLYCGEDWGPVLDPVHSPKIYTVVYFVLLYALPVFVITILYSFIALKVWFRKIPGNTIGREEARRTRTRRKVLRMLLTVVAVFVLCWLPLHVNMFLMYFVDKFEACGVPSGLSFFAIFLGHANSAINPCLYVIFNADFRRGFKDIICLCIPNKTFAPLTLSNIWASSAYNLQEAANRSSPEVTKEVELKQFHVGR